MMMHIDTAGAFAPVVAFAGTGSFGAFCRTTG